METHNIDSSVKKIVDGSADYYDADANAAKGRIWKNVQRREQGHKNMFLLRTLAAACILLLLITSAITVSLLSTKKTVKSLSEMNRALLQNSIRKDHILLSAKEPVARADNNIRDTVYIEKKVPVPEPVIKTIKVVDTVYVRQIVYVEKEHTPDDLAAVTERSVSDSGTQIKAGNYETVFLIGDHETDKPKKRIRLLFRLGENKDQPVDRSLAFSTRF